MIGDMSLSLRVQYQVRSLARFFVMFRLPAVFTSPVSKAAIYAIVILFFAGYVVQISHLTTGGYEIASLEKGVATLEDESSKLASEIASFQSIASIQKRLKGISMVPAKNITYLKANSMSVAER